MRSGLFLLSVGLLALRANLPGTSGQNVTDDIPPSSPPTVHGFLPPLARVPREKADKFICVVKGINPDSVSLRWFHSSEEVAASADSRYSPVWEIKLPDKLITFSTLSISQSDWIGLAAYACRVEPKAPLPLRLRRTTDQDTGKPSTSAKFLFWPRFQEDETTPEVTIGCIVQGALSKNMTIVWLNNTTPFKSDALHTVENGEGDGEPSYKYETVTTLSQGFSGSVYTCSIHPKISKRRPPGRPVQKLRVKKENCP